MTDDPYEVAGTSKARWLLAESEEALWDVLQALKLMKKRMEAGENLSPAEMQKGLMVLGATRAKLLEEVRKHERQIFLEHGLLADAPLDFDEVRREIGRNLDRLRDGGGAGDVPEVIVE